jgi:hypothetical protein
MSSWMLCSDCHRVLQIQHGPICPECLTKRLDMQNRPPEPTPEPDLAVEEPGVEAPEQPKRRGRKPKAEEPEE